MEVQVTTENGFPTQGLTMTEERPQRPDPEVPEKPTRKSWTAEEKRRILMAAEEAEKVKGGLGELLRRERIYSSHLKKWRQQRERGEIEGLSPKKRGRKVPESNALERQLRTLEKKNKKLEKRLKRAELLLSIQKKFAEMMEIELPPAPPEVSDDDE